MVKISHIQPYKENKADLRIQLVICCHMINQYVFVFDPDNQNNFRMQRHTHGLAGLVLATAETLFSVLEISRLWLSIVALWTMLLKEPVLETPILIAFT